MATVIIPTPLRKFTGNNSRLNIEASTVKDAVDHLSNEYPDLKKHLIDEKGNIRSFINIFVGEDDIRDLKKEDTTLEKDAVVSIVPAIAGGSISLTGCSSE